MCQTAAGLVDGTLKQCFQTPIVRKTTRPVAPPIELQRYLSKSPLSRISFLSSAYPPSISVEETSTHGGCETIAPTDIAAFHIHSSTYHSALGISPKEKCKDTRRTIRRMERNREKTKKDEREENNKEGGEVASENLGEDEKEDRAERRQ